MLIALSATSQPYTWLPVAPTKTECGYVIDSVSIYNMAENKRLAVDCYEDAYARDSIIAQQDAVIQMQAAAYQLLLNNNAQLQGQLITKTQELTAEKPKKLKWGGGGVALGFLFGLLVK